MNTRLMKKYVMRNNLTPEYIIFFITNKCNCRCDHCFYKVNLNKNTQELSLREIKKISKSMPNFTYLSLTGGEPFMRKDIDRIANIFCTNNKIKQINIPTNGTFPEVIYNKTKKILNENKIKLKVKISLDNLWEKHDKIKSHKGCFKKALTTIDKLKSIQDKRFRLGIIIAYSSENESNIINLFSFLKDNIKPDSISINWARQTNVRKGNIAKYLEISKLANQYNNNFYKDTVSEIVINSVNGKHILNCYSGKLLAVISETGDLYPCEILNKKIGNFRQNNYNFNELWNNKRAEKIRKEIIDNKCYCTYECVIPFNILFNPKGTAILLKNTIKRFSEN